jgi:hypothetical protein
VRVLLAALVLVVACARSSSPSDLGTTVTPHDPPPPPPPESVCIGSNMLGWLGRTRLVVGLSGTDAAAAAAPYDVRYQYLAGHVMPAGGCNTCQGCDGSWWGCWQEANAAPGLFVTRFIASAKANGQIPMFTYYMVLPGSGVSEGAAEVAAVNDSTFLARYLGDWRFLLEKIGTEKVLLHVEPDFWGYGERAGSDPHAIPAAVKAAAPADCGALEDSLAGLGRCMIAMVRFYAPNARVGLHASAWASGYDCFNAYCPDATAEGTKVGSWLGAAGANDGDFVVSDMSDRDADWYRITKGDGSHWWDTAATTVSTTTPSFVRTFAWSKAVVEAAGRPLVWWQTPLGNSLQGNTANHWKDNRVEHLFGHMSAVAAAHGIGVVYGAGEGAQTGPETDGGVLAASTQAYVTGGGAALCP